MFIYGKEHCSVELALNNIRSVKFPQIQETVQEKHEIIYVKMTEV